MPINYKNGGIILQVIDVSYVQEYDLLYIQVGDVSRMNYGEDTESGITVFIDIDENIVGFETTMVGLSDVVKSGEMEEVLNEYGLSYKTDVLPLLIEKYPNDFI